MELSGSELVATGAVALVALVGIALSTTALIKLHRLKQTQSMILGERGTQDLAEHAAGLQTQFETLRSYVENTSTESDARMETIESRLSRAVTHCALVRYDAYGEQSGHQSTSIALLDSVGSGVVLSSIIHRDHARLYSKVLSSGKPERELSPEETDAVEKAMAA